MRALALALLLLAPAEQRKRLAVLEFENNVPAKQGVDRIYFSDLVRGHVQRSVPGLMVMTRESTEALLKGFGTSLAACQEAGECEVEIGRKLQADYVVSGRLTKVGRRFKLTLRLHETESGSLLRDANASGDTIEALDDATAKAVADLAVPLAAPAPRTEAPPTRAQLESTQPPAPAKPSAQDHPEWPLEVTLGVGIGPLVLGKSTPEDVLAFYGRDAKIRRNDDTGEPYEVDYLNYEVKRPNPPSRPISFDFVRGVLSSFSTGSGQAIATRGVKYGTTREQLVQVFGSPDTTKSDVYFVVYDYPSLGVRFHLGKEEWKVWSFELYARN